MKDYATLQNETTRRIDNRTMKVKPIKIIFWTLILFVIPLMQSADLRLTAIAAESELTLEQILDRMEKQYTDNNFNSEFIQ